MLYCSNIYGCIPILILDFFAISRIVSPATKKPLHHFYITHSWGGLCVRVCVYMKGYVQEKSYWENQTNVCGVYVLNNYPSIHCIELFSTIRRQKNLKLKLFTIFSDLHSFRCSHLVILIRKCFSSLIQVTGLCIKVT